MEDYLGHIDLYEVEKNDYRSYEYRCKDRKTMKITPREGIVVFRDVKTGEWLYGYAEENVMMMPARRYFIFFFLPEEELGPYLTFKEIRMSDEEYMEFLKLLVKQKESNNEKEN